MLLKWVKNESAYVIEIQQGKAAIQEIERNGSKLYLPSIEDKTGNLIASFEHGFDDFETANGFIWANLIELDRIGISETEFTRQLLSTLDSCLILLNESHRAFHQRRIANIKNWLTHSDQNFDTDDLPIRDWTIYDFNWNEDKGISQADISPHGTAIISVNPTANASRFVFGKSAANYHHIQITDISGIQFVDPFNNHTDFVIAENRLREILSELEKPFVEEIYVEHLAFTLQICQQLLPANADPIHFIRLNFIENYLAEVLP